MVNESTLLSQHMPESCKKAQMILTCDRCLYRGVEHLGYSFHLISRERFSSVTLTLLHEAQVNLVPNRSLLSSGFLGLTLFL